MCDNYERPHIVLCASKILSDAYIVFNEKLPVVEVVARSYCKWPPSFSIISASILD